MSATEGQDELVLIPSGDSEGSLRQMSSGEKDKWRKSVGKTGNGLNGL